LSNLTSIPIERLKLRIRVREDLGDLNKLADSIKRDGILNPLLVSRSADGIYEVVCGHRRLVAATLAGLKEVPARLVGPLDTPEVLELIWKENELRKSLTLEEKALLLTALVNFYGVRKVARRLNLPKSTVETMTRAGRVISEVRKIVRTSDSGKKPRIRIKVAEVVERAVSKAGYKGGEYWNLLGKIYLMLEDLPTATAVEILSRWVENPTLDNLKALVQRAKEAPSIPSFEPPSIEERVPLEVQGGVSLERLLIECGYSRSMDYDVLGDVRLKLVKFRGDYPEVYGLLCPRCNRPIRCRVCGAIVNCLCGFPHLLTIGRRYRYAKVR